MINKFDNYSYYFYSEAKTGIKTIGFKRKAMRKQMNELCVH